MYLQKWKIFNKYYGYSGIKCDEIMESYNEETKTFPANYNEEDITYRTQNFCILLGFFLIINILLITGNIYCYLIEY